MCVCVGGGGGGGRGPGHIPKFTRSTHFLTLRKGEQPLVEVLLYVHRNRRFNYQGRGPRTSTSTFTQLLSSDVVNNLHHNNKCSGGGENCTSGTPQPNVSTVGENTVTRTVSTETTVEKTTKQQGN